MSGESKDPLSAYLRSKSEWRREQEREFPNDSRQERSADALEQLADHVESPEASQESLDRLRPHLFDADTLGGERTLRVVSRYGLGTIIVSDHHAAFLDELGVLCVLDAYEHAGKHGGEDPSGTLVAYEVEAAKDGVYLPRRYFERWLEETQAELEEAVAGYRAGAEASEEEEPGEKEPGDG